jgi:PAS domain S-box-containing protein
MELMERQERLNYLLSSNPAIIFSCRADLSPGITFISDNVERILGYKPDVFYNEPMFWIEHVHPDDRNLAKEKYPQLLQLKKWEREYRFQHKDGSYRWMHGR